MLCLKVMTYLRRDDYSSVQSLRITRVTPKLGPPLSVRFRLLAVLKYLL